MARAVKNSVGDYIRSLSRSELESLNPAEVFKLIEFVVLQEDRTVSAESTVAEVREAIFEWCCGSIHHWDVLEKSPWFLDVGADKSGIRHAVAKHRQRTTSDRRAAETDEIRQLTTFTEAEETEFFAD
jgi:hypothetical protein